MDREQRIVDNRTAPKNNRVWIVGAAAVLFIVLVVGGSYLTSRDMNRTADTHGMSAGRPGDASPNLIQEHQNAPSARGSTTFGANSNSSVPPASR
jgi:hypothetical protein